MIPASTVQLSLVRAWKWPPELSQFTTFTAFRQKKPLLIKANKQLWNEGEESLVKLVQGPTHSRKWLMSWQFLCVGGNGRCPFAWALLLFQTFHQKRVSTGNLLAIFLHVHLDLGNVTLWMSYSIPYYKFSWLLYMLLSISSGDICVGMDKCDICSAAAGV